MKKGQLQPRGEVTSLLTRWFQTAARDLPWRRERSAWRTWVSELMLQQTTVSAVAPRFEEFLKRFPDARAMAAASEQDVVEAWAGLGYYSRARNLHCAARLVVERPHFSGGSAGCWRALVPGSSRAALAVCFKVNNAHVSPFTEYSVKA